MRKISGYVVLVFGTIFSSIMISAGLISFHISEAFLPERLFGVGTILGYIFFHYTLAFASYRIFLKFASLQEGNIEIGSTREFWANLNILFYLLIFNTFVRTNLFPVPLMRLVYQALGTKMGPNSYSGGALLDPPLTSVGANTLIGHNATIFAHVIEKESLSFHPVEIGNNVTIGANSNIMPGVKVGDQSIIATGSLVTKGTVIGKNEIWAGVPAKKIVSKSQQQTIRTSEKSMLNLAKGVSH